MVPPAEDFQVRAAGECGLDPQANFAMAKRAFGDILDPDIFLPMEHSGAHTESAFVTAGLRCKAKFQQVSASTSCRMDLLKKFIDIVLHLQEHLNDLLVQFGPWFYGLLFSVIFCETGLVVTPFLPGDSLLFAVGALAADPKSGLHIGWCAAVIAGAAFLGDNVNYWLGKLVGRELVRRFPELISRSISIAPTPSSRSTAARRSSWPGSSQSFAPLHRLSRDWGDGIPALHVPERPRHNAVGGFDSSLRLLLRKPSIRPEAL